MDVAAFTGTFVSPLTQPSRRLRIHDRVLTSKRVLSCALRSRTSSVQSTGRYRRARNTARGARVHDSPTRKADVDLGSEERLQKVMSRLGVASRRKSESMIDSGRVRVNGRLVKEQGILVNPRKDKIVVDGKALIVNQTPVWVAVHKPRGYLSVPKEGYKWTVESLVPKARAGNLTSVGAIEEDFSGLVLMTNEKGCIPELVDPRNRHVKEWIVDCDGIVTNRDVDPLRIGVLLPNDPSGVPTLPASITIRGSGKVELSRREYRTLTRIVVRVRESRHHLIQRLFESVGITVARASRRSFGPVLLGSLERRSFRYLTLKEIKALKRGVRERR